MNFKPAAVAFVVFSLATLSGCATLDLAPTDLFLNDPAGHAGLHEARFPGPTVAEVRQEAQKAAAR